MFVRLFVDENLDRIVPISKQPKEKIQAIIDSCTRQFPEFAERARKRIRTYLKSCRRNKKVRGELPSGNSAAPAWDATVSLTLQSLDASREEGKALQTDLLKLRATHSSHAHHCFRLFIYLLYDFDHHISKMTELYLQILMLEMVHFQLYRTCIMT